jgi:hypothetical protein
MHSLRRSCVADIGTLPQTTCLTQRLTFALLGRSGGERFDPCNDPFGCWTVHELDKEADHIDRVQVDDSEGSVLSATRLDFKTRTDATRMLCWVIGCVADVKYPGTPTVKVLTRGTLAETGLDQLDNELTPTPEGIAIRDRSRPIAMASLVVRVKAVEGWHAEESPVRLHGLVDITNDHTDVVQVTADLRESKRNHD